MQYYFAVFFMQWKYHQPITRDIIYWRDEVIGIFITLTNQINSEEKAKQVKKDIKKDSTPTE